MKGLLKKEFYMILQTIKSGYVTLLIFSAFFILLAVSTVKGNFAGFLEFDIALYLTCYFPLMFTYVPLTLLSQDKMYKYNEFEITFPISDKEKVLSKYISSTLAISSSIFFIMGITLKQQCS